MPLGVTGPLLRAAGLAVGPAQERAVPRLRDLRLRRRHRRPRRLLGAIHGAGRRDARVAADHRAGARPAEPGPDDGRRQEDRLAGAARARPRRAGQLPRPRPHDHGDLDGGPDPPLQAGHRGLPGAGRARSTCRSSRRAASSARTSSPTAAPGRTGCTCATRASSTCSPCRRCRGRHDLRRHRRGRLHRPGDGVEWTADAPSRSGRRRASSARLEIDRALPEAAVGAAADAAPGAVRRGLRQPRRDRVLRRAARPDQGRGRRGRDVLHDVQAQADRRVPGQRLHQHAVRGDGRRRDLRRAAGAPRGRPQNETSPTTARSPSSTSSAWPPATSRRS